MKRILVIAALLALSAPAVADMNTAVVPGDAFTCTPGEFTVKSDYGGLLLTGTYEAPSGGYTYATGTLSVDSSNTGIATITIRAPDAATPQQPTPLPVKAILGGAGSLTHLIVSVVKPFEDGPDKIECTRAAIAR